MKRLLFLSFLLIASNSYAKWPWEKLGLELNAVKVDLAKQADAVVKANVDIGANMKALADVKAQVGDISTRIDSKVDAKIAAYDKSSKIENTIGRDQTTTTTNDTALMKEMVTTYKAIICLLIAQMVGLVIQMIVLVKYIASLFQLQIMEKDKMVDRERQSRDDKDRKADEWKERYIESVTGHKTNGLTPGQEEANKVYVETVKEGVK